MVATEVDLQIAVVSDLHCHALGTDGKKESHLIAGALRSPSTHHPLESFLDLVRQEELRADAVIAPGDFANKICQLGFSCAWDMVQEAARVLEAESVVPALGNHDVDSRKEHSHDPFEIPRRLRSDFPFTDKDHKREFFTDGSCLVPIGPHAEAVVVNSVIDHHDEESAKRGSYKPERLASLKKCMEEDTQRPVRIAVMHHHPILHSSPALGDHDVIATGDTLLASLAAGGCGLVIHGHKHHPRLREVTTPSGRLPVLAAGSFSAILGEQHTLTRNVCHHISIERFTNGMPRLRGRISTWEWHLGTGWEPTTVKSSGLPFLCGFGSRTSPENAASALATLANEKAAEFLFGREEVLETVPDLQFLSPPERASLEQGLREVHGLRLGIDDDPYEMGRLYSVSRRSR